VTEGTETWGATLSGSREGGDILPRGRRKLEPPAPAPGSERGADGVIVPAVRVTGVLGSTVVLWPVCPGVTPKHELPICVMGTEGSQIGSFCDKLEPDNRWMTGPLTPAHLVTPVPATVWQRLPGLPGPVRCPSLSLHLPFRPSHVVSAPHQTRPQQDTVVSPGRTDRDGVCLPPNTLPP
jgi:hypothetical protein